MKKLLTLVLLLICLSMVACGKLETLVEQNVSDLRVNYFEGLGDNYFASLSCGYREENFAYDGVSTTKVECGVLTLGFFDICSYNKITVVLSVDGMQSEVVLDHSPFEELFMADIGSIVQNTSAVTLNLKGSSQVLELKEVSTEWEIGYKNALNIGTNHFAEEIKKLSETGKIDAEFYLKVISKDGFDKTYWYFGITDKAGNVHFCLIDTASGDVTEITNYNTVKT